MSSTCSQECYNNLKVLLDFSRNVESLFDINKHSNQSTSIQNILKCALPNGTERNLAEVKAICKNVEWVGADRSKVTRANFDNLIKHIFTNINEKILPNLDKLSGHLKKIRIATFTSLALSALCFLGSLISFKTKTHKIGIATALLSPIILKVGHYYASSAHHQFCQEINGLAAMGNSDKETLDAMVGLKGYFKVE